MTFNNFPTFVTHSLVYSSHLSQVFCSDLKHPRLVDWSISSAQNALEQRESSRFQHQKFAAQLHQTMSQSPTPHSPSLSWRMASATIMGITGILSRSFLHGLNSVEVTGLSRFLEILDSRKDPERRQRGLLTGTFTPRQKPSNPGANPNSLQPC